ncbi:MAG: NfeD family protein [Desulfobacterales bacterium]|nr:NfeD family protein [Desulfobacterales bacterium]
MISPFLVWFLIGVGFLIAELQAPGFILIFFTAGCWITSVVAWLTDISITWQIVLSIVSSLVLLVALRKFGIKTFKGDKISSVDEAMADAKIGKTALVTRAIAPHVPGEIKAMGSFWRAEAEMEIAEGAAVVIESQASQDGLTYKVRPV